MDLNQLQQPGNQEDGSENLLEVAEESELKIKQNDNYVNDNEEKKKALDDKLEKEMDSAKDALEFMKEMPQPYFVNDDYKIKIVMVHI